ncbi:uncharacterized protein EDB91DRAFT_1253114 [Suillus paluster]|uniref:uncharacterized protein n=1 Tax=Suillus paluster TaxID=48578 RepID=UPI001B87B2D2|nr:uncharacterized protein EDB91DRAFT_1253114 [Suillus paluster]KAG1729198.1 hypothetical protein EDB91DRAFT_1253114 [Suillus paluster]
MDSAPPVLDRSSALSPLCLPQLRTTTSRSFNSGEGSKRRDGYPLHWAIYVPTGRGIDNTYQNLENTDTFTIDFRRNQPHNPGAWRGSLTVGRVAVNHLASVAVTHHDHRWNCQNWVGDGLRYLSQQHCHITGETQTSLQTKMWALLEAWECGDI